MNKHVFTNVLHVMIINSKAIHTYPSSLHLRNVFKITAKLKTTSKFRENSYPPLNKNI